MARIAGINVPDNKQAGISLTRIFGIGRSMARKVCRDAGVDPARKVADLSEADLDAVRGAVAELIVEGNLRRQVNMNVKRLMDLGCYRGMRHRRGMPVRGQRTRTNARTRRGPRRPVRK